MKFKLYMSLAAALGVTALAACGGGEDSSEEASAEPCGEVQQVKVPLAGQHADKKFTVDDYSTNPPAGGDHNPDALDTGTFYSQPVDLGMAVHALEHGAVIGWTNDLSKQETKQLEDAFNKLYSSGYESLATVELPELDVPFALSAWGAVQKCEQFDASAIKPFVDRYYGTQKSSEGFLACLGRATKLPACADNKR